LDAVELFDMTGEVVLVSGAGTGIGRSIAMTLARHGARVALTGRHADVLCKTQAMIKAQDGTSAFFPADLGDMSAVPRLFDEVERSFGTVSVLVNNAGLARRVRSLEETDEGIASIMAINLDATLAMAREGARRMIVADQPGSIINIGSALSRVVMANTLAYSASKAALTQATRLLAKEWARHGIRVNELRAGWFETGLTEPFLKDGAVGILAGQVPLRRLGRLEPDSDLDGAILLLASRAGRYMTGSVVAVDGGFDL